MTSRVLTQVSAATTNLTPIGSNSARTIVTGWSIYNSGAAVAYVNFYWGGYGFGGSTASGFSGGADVPTVGTDVPAMSIAVPPASNAFLAPDRGVFKQGANCFFSTTTTPAANGTFSGAVAASQLITNIFYEQ